jgi:sarcosine oxidase gamma subunit
VRLDHVVAFGRRVAQLDDLDLRLTQRTTSPSTVSHRSAGVSHPQTLERLLVAGAAAPPRRAYVVHEHVVWCSPDRWSSGLAGRKCAGPSPPPSASAPSG